MPCTEIVKFPSAALVEAPIITEVLAPAATLKGLAGLDVTPAGSAMSDTCTEPVKPFVGLTETLTAGLVAPCVTEIEFDDRLRAKSAAGGGGGGPDPELPQPAELHMARTRIASRTLCRIRPMR